MDTTRKEKDYWDPSIHQEVEFSAKNTCRYLDIIRSIDSKHLSKKEGYLDDASLGAWLSEAELSASSESFLRHNDPSNRIRLLIVGCELDPSRSHPKISLSREKFALVEQHLKLPQDFLTVIPSDHLIRAINFDCNHQGASPLRGTIFKLPFYRSKFYQIAVTFEPATNITRGIILSPKNDEALAPLLTRFQGEEKDAFLSRHPLLLLILAIELEIERTSERLNEADGAMNELEESMGQHEYSDRPVGNPLETDFTTATRKLNHISKKVGVDTLNLGFVLLAVGTVDLWGVERSEETAQALGSKVVGAMKEKTTKLKDHCSALILLAEYEDKRSKTLIQVVYQFMAQKDAKVNIALAENSTIIARASKDDSAVMRSIAVETKRDSSAMKTIAILGMLFLPGTFVSAVFAIPVFNWDSDPLVVKPTFKYYWAIAVPLTVLVFLVWTLAILLPWRSWLTKYHVGSKQAQVNLELATGACRNCQ